MTCPKRKARNYVVICGLRLVFLRGIKFGHRDGIRRGMADLLDRETEQTCMCQKQASSEDCVTASNAD